MPSPVVRSVRLPQDRIPEFVTDPQIVEAYLEDASASAPGEASGLVRPRTEAEAAAFLRETAGKGVAVLPQAARSSLTGGAVPRGEVVISVENLDGIGPIGGGERPSVSSGPGVRLKDLQRELGERGFYYPPVPTYQEAMLGGTVSTNAGGAATFKYGVTRQWVRGLRVLLHDGSLLDLERGQTVARPGESFTVIFPDGRRVSVPVPSHRLPALKKVSAGYHSSDPLDLVDLFVGSEGTLGLITGVTVELIPMPASVVNGLVFARDLETALLLAGDLRREAERTRLERDPSGADVRAIELLDGRCLDLLRDHGDARRLRVRIPETGGAAILFELELHERTSNERAQEIIEAFLDAPGSAPAHPLIAVFSSVQRWGDLESVDLAFPEDDARREALHEFREAVPKRVNEILSSRRQADPALRKVGGDLIVPFQELPAMVRCYREGFERRGIPYAIWGHVSDGNLHPNALPRDRAEAAAAADAMREFADAAARLGGAPLSEHGVGRSPLKQELLLRFLGGAAIDGMRAIKKALDPEGRFAPGVIFPVGARP